MVMKMGKSQSKHQDGTTNINIEEHLTANNLFHEEHELKLWFILAVNAIQLLWILRKVLKKKWRRQGFDRARALSRDNLELVAIEK